MKSCPNKEALFGYLVGAIPEQTAELIAQHLGACQECERTVQALEGLSDTVISALRHQVQSDALAEEPVLQQAVSKLQQLSAGGVEAEVPMAHEPPQKTPTSSRTKRLGDYELLKKLGQGGMGTVYKARHTKLKRIVALKVLPKNRLASAEAVARFEREMEAVGRLDHPNIVRAMDAREVAGIRFLVMEYVDGLDLAEICQRSGTLSIPDVCEMLRQAALGLQCSQENGLVHRDVKPSNLMLTTAGEVKILDLGLAHVQEAESNEGEVTGAGQVMGTPDYMSPEQALESHNVDIRTDVYSLGCTFYRLLADRAPFSGPKYDTAMKKVAGHLHDEADPIQLLRPDVPKPIAVLIERMLSKDPDERPSTPSAVVDALAPFCQGSKLIGLLRDAKRKKRLAAATEASNVETDDLRGSDEVETSRDGPSVQEATVKPSVTADLDPYHRWLGIPPAEQPASRYRLLGLATFEDDPEVIRDAAARQMAHVRTYQLGPHAEMSQSILNELAAAKACLLNRQKKADYDAKLRSQQATPVADGPRPPKPQPAAAEAPVVQVLPSAAVSAARSAAGRWKPPTWMWTAASAAAFFVLLTIVLYIMTGKGRIKITLSDPQAEVEVKLDGDAMEIAGLGEPLRLRIGEHELVVSGSNFETISRKFTVRRGDNPVLEVELIPASPQPAQPPLVTQAASPGRSQADDSSPPPVPAARVPRTQPQQPQRWLGYDPGTGAQERLSEFADHVNFVLGPLPSRLQAQHIQSARALGLKLVLPVDTRESMTELLGSKIGLIKANKETIIGILAICPPYFKIDSNELTVFSRNLKAQIPYIEFWLALADGGQALPAYVVPAEVDCLMVDAVGCGTREEVERRARDVWPAWIAKAAGRQVVLCWDSWEKGTAGLVPHCQPDAISALGDAVEQLKLKGIMFSTYGDNRFAGESVSGIESRPQLVSEVQAIAARWGLRRESSTAAPVTVSPQSDAPLFPSAATAPATRRTVRIANWEDLKYGMFIHFGMSTFTGRNADRGDSPSTTYAPSQLDVRQWVRVAKESGMRYAVLTAKHHSGHCLWDSNGYDYDVATSGNKTDVVAEFIRACHVEGIKPGIYYSIVDGHNEPGLELQWDSWVTDRYFQLIKQQITELHTRHSEIYEQWFDLAGKLSASQRQELYTLIKKLNPNCLIAMGGQGQGSISGYLSVWPTDILGIYGAPGASVQHFPVQPWMGQSYYLPLEVHDTIGKNWWYQANDPVKTTKEFRALWRSTVGKGSNLLLNVPPDRTGRIPQNYVNVLREYKKIIDAERS